MSDCMLPRMVLVVLYMMECVPSGWADQEGMHEDFANDSFRALTSMYSLPRYCHSLAIIVKG